MESTSVVWGQDGHAKVTPDHLRPRGYWCVTESQGRLTASCALPKLLAVFPVGRGTGGGAGTSLALDTEPTPDTESAGESYLPGSGTHLFIKHLSPDTCPRPHVGRGPVTATFHLSDRNRHAYQFNSLRDGLL